MPSIKKHQVKKGDLVAETFRSALGTSNGQGENKTLVMCTIPGQPSCFEVRTQS